MKIKALLILAAALAVFMATPVKANNGDNNHDGDHFRPKDHVVKKTTVKVININKACVSQKVNAIANTGLNCVSRNIGKAEIKTGEAEVETNLWFHGNINRTSIGQGNIIDP